LSLFVILIISFFVFIICGVIGAALASEKGRGAAGFWLGFVFGPIGILIALLLKPSVSGLKPCPFCAELIQPAALKCRFCNADLPESFRAPAPTLAQDSEANLNAARRLAESDHTSAQISKELQKWRGLGAAEADAIANSVVARR
jgi:hypothetical protein